MPERYYRALDAGDTYTLLYPSCEISIWDWGTIEEHLGREIKARSTSLVTDAELDVPSLLIPGGAVAHFYR